MTLEMSPEQIQESKIYREWGLTDEEYLKIKDEILDVVRTLLLQKFKTCLKKISDDWATSLDGAW